MRGDRVRYRHAPQAGLLGRCDSMRRVLDRKGLPGPDSKALEHREVKVGSGLDLGEIVATPKAVESVEDAEPGQVARDPLGGRARRDAKLQPKDTRLLDVLKHAR